MFRLSDSKMNLEFPSGQPLVSSPGVISKRIQTSFHNEAKILLTGNEIGNVYYDKEYLSHWNKCMAARILCFANTYMVATSCVFVC